MKTRQAGFTLFEVILAIALAAVLLTLIGTSINLYLVQVDSGRTRVEESQLARSILAMIADDIRATTVYKPQDTSAIAQLMAKTATFNVDDIDKAADSTDAARAVSKAASGTTGGTGGAGTGAGAAGAATGGTSSSSSSSSTDGSDADDTTMQLGINGGLEELYVDATRLPKQEELFSTTTGYTNAQSPNSSGGTMGDQSAMSSGGTPASDLKTVRYFIRPGEAVEAGSASVTSLDPASQSRVGGLVRQEIPRAMRNFAEKNGGSDVLDGNAVMLAPEVVRIELRYFDGSEIADVWDMKEKKSLPVAVEIRLWLRSPTAASEPITSSDAAMLESSTHQYRQVVYLPMSPLAKAATSASGTGTSTTDSTGSTDASTSGNGATTGGTSAFGTE